MKQIITLLTLCFSLSIVAQETQKKNPYYSYDTTFNQSGIPIYATTKNAYGKLVDYSSFDKKGNKIEYAEYKSKGELKWKYIYKYDEKGDLIETIKEEK